MHIEIRPDYIKLGNHWNFKVLTIIKVPQCLRICILSVWFELHWNKKKEE